MGELTIERGERVNLADPDRRPALDAARIINGDPTRPICTGGDPSAPPDTSKLHGGGPAAARVGDAVAWYVQYATVLGVPLLYMGPASGPVFAITATALATSAVIPGTPWPAPPIAIPGTITSGSSKCEIG